MSRVPLGAHRAFYVVSPVYEVYSQSEVDPAELGRDVMLVCAQTKRRAKVLAVRAWRRGRPHGTWSRRNYVQYCNDENPFKGLEVHDAFERYLVTE